MVVAGATYRTDASGTTTVATAPGTVEVTVVKAGFAPATASVQVAAGAVQEVVVELQPQPTLEETVTVVASTRTDKRLEDQPMRVEVLAREEIEEKMLMTPGDIVMMLNEMGGMRVQATSPSLGAASVRIQGMRGRYTRVLSDGLPLFGDVGGLGLLQIPPMDLGQVEVIKGVASALYGAGAMGGVVNLLSRRPGAEAGTGVPAESLDARGDGRGHVSVRAALARLERLAAGRRSLAGDDRRERRCVGGSAGLRASGRASAALLGRRKRPDVLCHDRLHLRGPERRHAGRRGARRHRSAVRRSARDAAVRRRRGGPVPRQRPIRGDRPRGGRPPEPRSSVWRSPGARSARHGLRRSGRSWNGGPPDVGGRARDRTRRLHGRATCRSSTTPSPCRAHSSSTTSTSRRRCRCRRAAGSTSTASTARSSVRACRRWRAPDAGRADCRSEPGSSGPRRITEETEAAGLTRLTIQQPLEAERGLSASFDLSRTDGPLSYTATLFASRVNDPMHVERSPSYVLSTLPDPTTNVGPRAAGDAAARAVLRDGDVHLRAGARDRRRD